MKQLLVIISLFFLGFCLHLYLNKDVVERNAVQQITPDGIPDTLSSGSPVQWDSTWWDAWKEGDVIIVWEDSTDHSKGVKAMLKIVRDTKPWMRTDKYE